MLGFLAVQNFIELGFYLPTSIETKTLFMQGYFVSRPLPFAQLVKWLNDPHTQKKYFRRT